jgi:hypothetical protein
VLCIGRDDGDRPDPQLLSPLHFDDLLEAPLAQQPARAPRHDHGQRAPELLERGEVEVVEVDMGDEHSVDPAQGVRVGRPGTAQVRDSRPQHRVGQ